MIALIPTVMIDLIHIDRSTNIETYLEQFEQMQLNSKGY